MEFRESAFWQEIESIFTQPPPEDSALNVLRRGGRLCSLAQLRDRLDTAMRRAARNQTYAVFVLLQFTPQQYSAGENGEEETGGFLLHRLASCIRCVDSLSSLGEGRFALLLEDVKESSAVPVMMEKLNSTLAGCFRPEHATMASLLPTMAASLLPGDSRAVARVWLATEAALEQTLLDSRGSYRILPERIGRAAMQRLELSRDLHRAYRNDEFVLHYQPVVGLDDGRVRAVEGLMRWRHPQRGCLPPAMFLSLLEESGLIVPVGEQLLVQACASARRLIDSGQAGLRSCINISFRQLADPGFMLSVLDALYESSLAPGCLQLEFAESVLLRDSALTRRVLSELSKLGINLAVDRFGSGGLPLAELVRLPIGLIKLDPALVRRLPEDAMARGLTAGTAALAGQTGKRLAAVGVEQAAERQLLQTLACSEAQGSYYVEPLAEFGLGGYLTD